MISLRFILEYQKKSLLCHCKTGKNALKKMVNSKEIKQSPKNHKLVSMSMAKGEREGLTSLKT
jgi:hypothetical protein